MYHTLLTFVYETDNIEEAIKKDVKIYQHRLSEFF